MFNHQIFDFLKTAVLRCFKDEDKRKQSKWFKSNHFVMISLSVQEVVELKK